MRAYRLPGPIDIITIQTVLIFINFYHVCIFPLFFFFSPRISFFLGFLLPEGGGELVVVMSATFQVHRSEGKKDAVLFIYFLFFSLLFGGEETASQNEM